MKRKGRFPRLPALAVIVALAAVAAFLPELVSYGWHWTHGPEAIYGSWRVPVPNGWYAIHHGPSLALVRLPHLPFGSAAPTVIFLPLGIRKDLPMNLDSWTRAQEEIESRLGYRLAATREIAMAGAEGYCWEFVNRANAPLWWITCLAPAQDLSADFHGPRAFAGEFYSLLPRLHRAENR